MMHSTQTHSCTDHPRSRGVYDLGLRAGDAPAGSSPLARGLRQDGLARHGSPGIIPARAGFTRGPRRAGRRNRDHPRSRGVYAAVVCVLILAIGSSPLARGLHKTRTGLVEKIGIIPARAGFTSTSTGASGGTRDHPRSRGVYGVYRYDETWKVGSSPLARGLLGDDEDDVGLRGIIPARAGFTCGRSTRSTADPDHPRSRGGY